MSDDRSCYRLLSDLAVYCCFVCIICGGLLCRGILNVSEIHATARFLRDAELRVSSTVVCQRYEKKQLVIWLGVWLDQLQPGKICLILWWPGIWVGAEPESDILIHRSKMTVTWDPSSPLKCSIKTIPLDFTYFYCFTVFNCISCILQKILVCNNCSAYVIAVMKQKKMRLHSFCLIYP